MAKVEPYLHAKFHLDPSNHLATVHQCHRQTGQTDIWADRQRSDSIGRTVLQTVVQKLTRFRLGRTENKALMTLEAIHMLYNAQVGQRVDKLLYVLYKAGA